MLIHAQLLQDKFDTASKRVRILEQTFFLSCTCSQECVCELFEIVGYSVVSAAQPAFAPVPALTKWIADLQEHKQTPEYQAAVALSKERSSEHSRLSHQIWQQSKELAKAKALARKATRVSMNGLTLEEQDLVKAYYGGGLEQNLQNLLSQKPSAYRGVAACVSDLQNGQRWCRPV